MLRDQCGVVYDHVVGNIDHLSRTHLLGRAGTGKSYLINKLRIAATERDRTSAVCAYTNEIASDLGGQTIHKLFNLAPTTTGSRIKGPPAAAKYDVVFIDEYSLINRGDWNLIRQQLQRAKTKLVLVGDPYQLPPVKGTPNIVMEPGDTVELTKQWRNPEMTGLINWFVEHIKTGTPINKDELLDMCPHGPIEDHIHDNFPILLGYHNNLFHKLDDTFSNLSKENWRICTPQWGSKLATGDIVARLSGPFLKKDVIPTWSLTVHKSQGKTYEGSPLVMLDDILSAPRNLKMQALYVACTRGTKLPTLII